MVFVEASVWFFRFGAVLSVCGGALASGLGSWRLGRPNPAKVEQEKAWWNRVTTPVSGP